MINALIVLFLTQANSAVPHLTPTVKTSQYLGSGVRVGGVADRELALLDVKWMRASNKPVERLSLQIGEADGTSLKGQMGYFHVAYREKPQLRLSIDFSQVQKTRIDEQSLRRALAKSKFISKAHFTMDPMDGSTNLALVLNQAVKWDAFIQKEKGLLVLDLSLDERTH